MLFVCITNTFIFAFCYPTYLYIHIALCNAANIIEVNCTVEGDKLMLVWDPPSSQSGQWRYDISYQCESSTPVRDEVSTPNYTLRGLAPGTKLLFAVRTKCCRGTVGNWTYSKQTTR